MGNLEQRLAELCKLDPPLSWANIANQIGLTEKRAVALAARLGITKPPRIPSHETRKAFWTDDRCYWLGELVTLGMSWVAIAKQLECGEHAAMGQAKRLGLIKKPCSPAHEIHRERNAHIRELVNSGLSTREAAARVGVSPGVVAGVCDRAGMDRLKMPGGKPRRYQPPKIKKRKPIPPGRPTPLAEANRTHCRWPLWDAPGEPHVVCGREVVERKGPAWCEVHWRIGHAHGEDGTADDFLAWRALR